MKSLKTLSFTRGVDQNGHKTGPSLGPTHTHKHTQIHTHTLCGSHDGQLQ